MSMLLPLTDDEINYLVKLLKQQDSPAARAIFNGIGHFSDPINAPGELEQILQLLKQRCFGYHIGTYAIDRALSALKREERHKAKR